MSDPLSTGAATEPGDRATEQVDPARAGARQRHERRARPAVRRAAARVAEEAGMSTAEYAVGTVAACAFAAVLYRVVTGGSVVDGLSALVADALATLS